MQIKAGPSSSSSRENNAEKEDEDEEEEDEVIKAIRQSKEVCRNHPPSIFVEDSLSDICFHPESDIIALASVTGDVLM